LIVGSYDDTSNVEHQFVYDHGTFTTLDFPGASEASALFGGTFPYVAVNNSGAIVGNYLDASGVSHGFLYQNGTFTKIPDAPGAGTSPSGSCTSGVLAGTTPTGISASGVIVIDSCNDAGSSAWVLENGQFSSLNDPNAVPGGTFTGQISEDGRLVVGVYLDAGGFAHGFVATLTPRGSR
jgi:probable HAF family extracellular repeat protein